MGFALTLVYVFLTIISPEQFGREWASYHALQYLAGITALASLPSILSRTPLRSSVQTYLLLGFIIAIGFSQVANGWLGGAVESWRTFLPSAAVFFFIVANVTTIRRLKILTLIATASCLVLVVEALYGYYGAGRSEIFVLNDSLYSHNRIMGPLSRIRGAGFLSDPNDFAQMLLIALPLVFVAWRRRRVLANSLIVLIPATLLLWAIFLTHSRGGLIGLAVLALLATRRRLGTVASVVLTVVLVLGVSALGFTGGRAISAAEGADRLEAWANGLELFKSAPLFGIGFGGFTDFNGITAHNSLILCLAELGLLGSTIWVALLVTTTLSLNNIIEVQDEWETRNGGHGARTNVKRTSVRNLDFREEATPREISLFSCASPFTTVPATATDAETEIETVRQHMVPQGWVVAMRLALISFITTSWLLSRSYSTTMYLVLGLATATIALQRSAMETRDRSRWIFFTIVTEAVAIIFIYGIVRLRH